MSAKQALDPEVAREFVATSEAKMQGVIDALNAPGAKDKIKAITLTPAQAPGVDGVLYEKGPTPEEEAAATEPETKSAPVTEPELALKARPALTDAQVFDKVALFLDPHALGPIFISAPIRGKVYIGKYPNFAEMLSASRITGETKDAGEDATRVYEIAGELSVAIRGWLPEHDQRLDAVKANITDASKWPNLYAYTIFNQRDPRIGADMVVLWLQYLEWKSAVVPTEDELEKYEGRLTKRSS